MMEGSSGYNPLLQQEGVEEGSPSQRSWRDVGRAVGLGLLKAFNQIIDWSPLITVNTLQGSYPPVTALFYGTVAAVVVLVYAFLKRCLDFEQPGAVFPKTLDLGQFLLFGVLWVLALAFESNAYIGEQLVLWFNPFTTGGITLIMWASILRGRPFILEFVQAQMPAPVWKRMSAKKWFLDILTEAAWFWVGILFAMTAIVTIQPLIVSLCYDGKVNPTMQDVGNFFTAGQFVILFFGIFTSAREATKRERHKERAKEVKARGKLDDHLAKVHGGPPVISVTQRVGNSASSHYIRTLASPSELDEAGRILAEAFEGDELLMGFLDTFEGKVSFFTSSVRSMSYFNHVLGCFDVDSAGSGSCRCVMACIPVLCKTQEEITVFNSYEAWVEHGFQVPGATETDFPLPEDELVALGRMRLKRENRLTSRPFLYIAYCGAASESRGRGYGRSLLQYIVEESEAKKLPLVLETTSAHNITQYERYGFEVVDRVEGRPHWVLMVREVRKTF